LPKNLNETYFFINLFKYFSTFLSIYLSTYLFIFLLIYISIVLSIFLSIILSFYPLPFYISRAASSPPGVTLTCVAGSLFRSCVSISLHLFTLLTFHINFPCQSLVTLHWLMWTPPSGSAAC